MQKASLPSVEVPQAFADYLRSRTEIVAAYLFGSVAAGKAHKFSDVDVALLLAEGVDSRRGIFGWKQWVRPRRLSGGGRMWRS